MSGRLKTLLKNSIGAAASLIPFNMSAKEKPPEPPKPKAKKKFSMGPQKRPFNIPLHGSPQTFTRVVKAKEAPLFRPNGQPVRYGRLYYDKDMRGQPVFLHIGYSAPMFKMLRNMIKREKAGRWVN